MGRARRDMASDSRKTARGAIRTPRAEMTAEGHRKGKPYFDVSSRFTGWWGDTETVDGVCSARAYFSASSHFAPVACGPPGMTPPPCLPRLLRPLLHLLQVVGAARCQLSSTHRLGLDDRHLVGPLLHAGL